MTTLENINLNKLRITPVYMVFFDEEGLSHSLAFAEVLHKAVETCLHRIDEENIKGGKPEVLFTTKTLTDEQIAGLKLLADMRNSFPRGYSISWEPANIPKHFVLQLNLFGFFAKALPLIIPRLESIFTTIGNNKIKFVSVYDASMKALVLKRGKISPIPRELKIHDIDPPEQSIKNIVIELLSPVKLYKTQMHNFNMGLGDFTYHLIKRMMLIQYLYCEGPIPNPNFFSGNKNDTKPCAKCGRYIPEPELLKQDCADLNFKAKTIKIDIELQNQKLTKKMFLEGYTGSMHYKSNEQIYNMLIPILKLGEYVQIGSSVNYGMGRFKVDYDCYRFAR